MVHAYQNNGYYIILDVNSGAVHVVDEQAYALIPRIEEWLTGRFGTAAQTERPEDQPEKLAGEIADAFHADDEAKEVIGEILSLRADGRLYTEDPYRQYATAFRHRQTVVKALCLNVAHECNLACRYCFAGEGEYHGERALMSA